MSDVEEITVEKANIIVCSQEDLRNVEYALYLLGEKETDPKKKESFHNVGLALNAITNFYGDDALGSRQVLSEYYPDKFAKGE